jgi:hypothetical protein
MFRGQQRAVGELMMQPAPAGEAAAVGQCIGYAAFSARLDRDPAFAHWFASLEQDIRRLAADPDPDPDHRRLVALQHALLDLIDFLDDPPTRFPAEQRSRL